MPTNFSYPCSTQGWGVKESSADLLIVCGSSCSLFTTLLEWPQTCAGSEMGKWEPDGEFICTVFCPYNVGTKQNWIQVLKDIAVFLLAAVYMLSMISHSLHQKLQSFLEKGKYSIECTHFLSLFIN